MRDHPAVGEHRRRVAGDVDEGVVEPSLRDGRPHLLEERRTLLGELPAQRADRLAALLVPVVRPLRRGRVPLGELADEPPQHRPDRHVVVDGADRDLDRGVELLVGQAGGPLEQLAGQPDVVLDHACHQVHRGHLSGGGQPQAARRVEVHAARTVDLGPGRLPTPAAGGAAVLPRERPGERLVGAEARLERDVDDLLLAGHEAVRRPLQQQPSSHPLRWLASRRRDHPVEVEAGQVEPPRPFVGAEVEGLAQGVEERGEGVGRCRHVHHLGAAWTSPLDRTCAVCTESSYPARGGTMGTWPAAFPPVVRRRAAATSST